MQLWKVLIFVLAACMFSCAPSAHLKSIVSGDVNAYLQDAPKAEEHPNAGAIFLLSHGYVEFFHDGTSVVRHLHRYKIFSERGNRHASISIPYRERYQEVKILFANTIKPNGRIVPLDAKDIHDASRYAGFEFYTDIRQKRFTMPAVENNCVIEYAYEIRNLKPMLPFDFSTTFFCQTVIPLEKDTLEVVLPAHIELKYKKYLTPENPRVTQIGNKKIYVFTSNKQKEIIPEPRMPLVTDRDTFPQFSMWTLGSWETISRWYISLVKEQMQADGELEAFTKQLVKDKKTDEEKIKAIFDFVSQKIRYVAVLLGPYTHKPHAAHDIFKKRYGDCKDKTTLLLTMLKIAGIEGLPALVPARSESFDESMPSLEAFNHVIAAVPSGTTYYWLDATNETASFNSVPFFRPTTVLVIHHDGSYRFMQTPRPDDRRDFTNLEIKSTVNEEGDADVDLTFTFSGKAAEAPRYFYKYLSPEQRKKQFEKRGVEIKELTFSSFTETDVPFTINLKGTYKNLAQKLDEKTMVLTNAVRVDSYRDITSARERKYPIKFRTSLYSKEKYIFIFPAGFTIKNLPPASISEKPFKKRIENFSFRDSSFEISVETKEFEHSITLANFDDFKRNASDLQKHESSLKNILFEKKDKAHHSSGHR